MKRQGISMKQKLLEMIQVTVWLHTDEFIFVWFYKNQNRHQNHSSGAKTELLRRRVPQLSARVNHGTPAAGVIGHIFIN